MTVLRHEKSTEEYEVEIQKKSGKGAGLCFAAFWSNKGVYVKELVSPVFQFYRHKRCFTIHTDRVLLIFLCRQRAVRLSKPASGGLDVRDASLDDIAFHMKISNPLQMKLARYHSAKQ